MTDFGKRMFQYIVHKSVLNQMARVEEMDEAKISERLTCTEQTGRQGTSGWSEIK